MRYEYERLHSLSPLLYSLYLYTFAHRADGKFEAILYVFFNIRRGSLYFFLLEEELEIFETHLLLDAVLALGSAESAPREGLLAPLQLEDPLLHPEAKRQSNHAGGRVGRPCLDAYGSHPL